MSHDLLICKCAIDSVNSLFTYCKPEAESDISDGVNTSVNCVMSLVYNISQLRHHGAVHHPYGETQPGHGQDEVVGVCGKRDLECSQYITSLLISVLLQIFEEVLRL